MCCCRCRGEQRDVSPHMEGALPTIANCETWQRLKRKTPRYSVRLDNYIIRHLALKSQYSILLLALGHHLNQHIPQPFAHHNIFLLARRLLQSLPLARDVSGGALVIREGS